MMAVINLCFCGKLLYIIETCKKLNLPIDLQIFRGELNYWGEFIEFSLNDCTEEIEKYRVIEELSQPKNKAKDNQGEIMN